VIHRILVAVDDSPAALAAARLAVDLAHDAGAALRVITVVADHATTERLRADLGAGAGDGHPDRLSPRRTAAADAVLRYVASLAAQASVPVAGIQLDGEPAARILEQARDWPADLVVLGRSDLPGTGRPYIGGHTRRVLEFAEQPVLVVPHREGQRVTR
jgi:nucleotide-binding universal stress UspA family protein